MKSASLLLILVSIPALFLSCTSFLVKEMMRNSAVPNWIYIHTDPQVGDYALHETAQGAVVKYRVEDSAGQTRLPSSTWETRTSHLVL